MYEVDAEQRWQRCVLVVQVWQAMSVAMSSLDVLAALARFAQHEGGATCFPEFVRDSETPELDCKGLWHPALAGRTSSSPIPTDLNVGSEYGAALLLTGPNMVRSLSLKLTFIVPRALCLVGNHSLHASRMSQISP